MAQPFTQAQSGDELARQQGYGSVDEMMADIDRSIGGASFTEGLAARRAKLEQLTGRTNAVQEFQQGEGAQNLAAIEGSQRLPGEAPSDIIKSAMGVRGTGRQILSTAASNEVSGLNALTDFINTAVGIKKESQAAKLREQEMKIKQAELGLQMKELGLKYDESGEIVVDPEAIGKKSKKQQEETDKLRAEFMGQQGIKDFVTVKTQYDKIQSATPNAAGDLSLIFAYMKMLDPGSTVREGEYANAESAAGVPERIRTLYNKVKAGDKLSDSQRGEFKRESGKLFNSHITNAKERAKFYEELAKERGLSADDITGVLGPLEPIVSEAMTLGDENQKAKRKGILGGIIDAIFGQQKTIRVKDKSTGKTGTIPESEFNETLYERIN